MRGSAGSASNRATVGIASSTGPRSASTGSAPPSAALSSSLPTRSGRARSRASRAAPFRELGSAAKRGPGPDSAPERETLAEPDPQPVGTRPATQ